MTILEHLLIILMEECDETSQRASKALRFGVDEVQPGQDLTNFQRLIYEFNDIVAMMQLIQAELRLDQPIVVTEMVRDKMGKVLKYLEYSKELKTLS